MHHCFSILGDVTLTSAVKTLIETLLCMFGGHNFIKLFSKKFYEIMPSKHAQ